MAATTSTGETLQIDGERESVSGRAAATTFCEHK